MPNMNEAVKALLEGMSPAEVRALGVQALRRWRGSAGKQTRTVQMHGHLGLYAVEILAKAKGVHLDANQAKEVFLNGQELPFLAPVMEFVWWLVRAGLAYPGRFNSAEGLLELQVTSAGLAFLDSAADHPLAPEFISRFRERNPSFPDEVLLLLHDVRACLDVGLLRPAMVLLGLTYETAVECVLIVLLQSGLILEDKVRSAKAGQRIGLLQEVVSRLDLKPEERRRMNAAVDFADSLRQRRNDASHPQPEWPFVLDELEEMLVSCARHLPLLWGIATAKDAKSGASNNQ